VVSKLEHHFPELSKKDPAVSQVLQEVKRLEHEGYQFEAAEGSFELLARRSMGIYQDLFRPLSFHVSSRQSAEEEGGEVAEAIVKVEVDGEIYHTVSEGDGPVNAMDRALRKALEVEFPSLQLVHLEDYKVRVMSSSDGTAARVRVLIESSDGEKVWGTVGVSSNIIEASWIALADSLHFKLMHDAAAHGKVATS
jgi:2-isopropylmalate synthase